MALFTICATNREHTARPCAVIEAVSQADAMRRAKQLRQSGDIGFVPEDVHLTARRSSRREARAFHAFMQPATASEGPPLTDPGYTHRSQRRLLAFFQKLWLGTFEDAPAS